MVFWDMYKGEPYVYVRWHVTLDTRVVVDEPRSSNVATSLVNGVFDDVLHLRKPVLKFMGQDQSRETGSNSYDFQLPRSVGVLLVQGKRICHIAICVSGGRGTSSPINRRRLSFQRVAIEMRNRWHLAISSNKRLYEDGHADKRKNVC